MSFIDDILDVGSSVWGALTGPGVAAGIARATALGLLLNEVTSSINKDNQKPETATSTTPDYGVREQVDPDTQHSVPVVYGQAFLGGIVTDAVLSEDNMTMWYCITISEQTGKLLSDDSDSVITFEEIYWNQSKITFNTDGITAESLIDTDGNSNSDINGLVRIYCFSGNSNSPVVPEGYSNGSLLAANGVMPNWTFSHSMEDLVFAIISVDYNKEKNITGLGDIEFKLKNTLTQPGDVLYDYMTNTRYGAGIQPEEINS
jgi:hypothetical protein